VILISLVLSQHGFATHLSSALETASVFCDESTAELIEAMDSFASSHHVREVLVQPRPSSMVGACSSYLIRTLASVARRSHYL